MSRLLATYASSCVGCVPRVSHRSCVVWPAVLRRLPSRRVTGLSPRSGAKPRARWGTTCHISLLAGAKPLGATVDGITKVIVLQYGQEAATRGGSTGADGPFGEGALRVRGGTYGRLGSGWRHPPDPGVVGAEDPGETAGHRLWLRWPTTPFRPAAVELEDLGGARRDRLDSHQLVAAAELLDGSSGQLLRSWASSSPRRGRTGPSGPSCWPGSLSSWGQLLGAAGSSWVGGGGSSSRRAHGLALLEGAARGELSR